MPDQKKDEELLNCMGCATYLGMHPGTIGEYIRRGIIKGEKVGFKWMATRSSLDEYRIRKNNGWTIRQIISEVAKSL